MIRMVQSRSSAQAKAYFNEALSQSDYFLNDQELPGVFCGKLVTRLGIEKNASKHAFDFLCENIHPVTGKRLTQRNVKDRTIGYDINFHVPKSVSVLHVLSKDDHILDAFRESVADTMRDMEQDSMTRVRKKGQDENRSTGEWLWAEFLHQTARPVDGSNPDPHLHAHCFTFNVTWDKTEKQYKACQFQFTKRDMPYYQARFHKRLSDNLIKLGYRIRRTQKSFEVAGVPQDVIDLFSKRTNEIGRFVKEHSITDANEKDKVGARTRAKKQKGLTMAQLKKDWRRQIHDLGMKHNKADGKIIRHAKPKDILPVTARECVSYAVKHSFERASIMQDRRVLASAYRYGMGTSNTGIDGIDKEFANEKTILRAKDNDAIFCTTKEILQEEKSMIDLARSGKGMFAPFYQTCPSLDLSGDQEDTARALLTSTDQVFIIEGRAGTGKTTLMKEVIAKIEATGKKVFIAAPTAQAARQVLKQEGFEHAETVAKLLTDPSLQNQLTDAVLWVDEGGLLGVKDMVALLRLAKDKRARVVLAGDTRQHAPVSRGDGLRLLRLLGGLSIAGTSKIYRQQSEAYREAVQAISEGDIDRGFQVLDGMGAIVETDPALPGNCLVKDYLAAINEYRSVLTICPTHHQGETITALIRQGLKDAGKLGKDDHPVKRLVNLNLTEAEKADSQNYMTGQVLQFNQNNPGIKRGSVWTVKTKKGNNLVLINEKLEEKEIAVKEKNDFDVFQLSSLPISIGDNLRITRNGFDADKKRLDNGQEFEVAGFDKNKRIRLLNTRSRAEYVIPENFGHLAHGYCITSHASQGKTVDTVLIYQPAATFPATDMKQFYVSVSRGRNNVRIYTDDKAALFDHISIMRERKSAIELFGLNKKTKTKSQHQPITPPYPAYRL